MSSSNLAWLDLAQDPHNKFSLEFSLKAVAHFEKQPSILPVLKLRSHTTMSHTMMSELFRHRDDFKAVLKQLDEVFCDDVAELFAERHFSWNPVTFESNSTGDSATETDSISTESELEDDSTTDHNSDSGSDLWEGFDFPQLTAEEDAELTLALQGNTSHSTIFDTGASSTATSPQEATVENSYMRSGLQGQGASELGPLSSPPPYMADFGDNSQPANRFFIDNNNRIVPTDGQIYILVDGVYHVIRQM